MKKLLHAVSYPIRRATRFVRNCWTECPKHEKCTMLLLSGLANLGLALLLMQGCASTPKGISREEKIYNVATNVVGSLQQAVPFLPAPVGAPVGIVLGGISAMLAAWNLHQQQALKVLKKDNAATELLAQNSLPPAPVQPPAPAALPAP